MKKYLVCRRDNEDGKSAFDGGNLLMRKKVKWIILAVMLVGITAFVCIYTRPLEIEQRYPVLDLSQCTQIRGYYYIYTGANVVDDTLFIISPDDIHFDDMLELFQSASFRNKLRNILPEGTKTHVLQDGDFRWEVMFHFENVRFPNGDTGSGGILHIRNFFGDVELFFDGEQTKCSVKNQEKWLQDVLDIIVQCFAE